MKNFVEDTHWFDDMVGTWPPYRRYLFIGALVLVLVATSWFWGFKKLVKSINIVKGELQELSHYHASLDTVSQKLTEFTHIHEKMGTAKPFSELFSFLIESAALAHLELEKTGVPEETQTGHSGSIELHMRGTFDQFSDFLRRISYASYAIPIVAVHLARNEDHMLEAVFVFK